MKIRTGFVSNSSSSSFILPVSEDVVDIKISLDDFLKVFENSDRENSINIHIHTVTELEQYIVRNYGCRGDSIEKVLKEESYAKEMYDDIKTFLDKGQTVLVGDISYHDRLGEKMLEAFGAKIEN